MHEVTAVHSDGGHRLFLRFADGAEGVMDLAGRIEFTGVFAPLRNPDAFALVAVNPDFGTVAWPTGADLCPDVLHAWLTGEAVAGGGPSALPAARWG